MTFMLRLRRHLIDYWGLRGVQVKEEELMMKVGRVPVMKATVNQGKMEVEWLDDGWKNWDELQKSEKWKELIRKAEESLDKASAWKGKGKGKGPSQA